jgi:hypothetical protein
MGVFLGEFSLTRKQGATLAEVLTAVTTLSMQHGQLEDKSQQLGIKLAAVTEILYQVRTNIMTASFRKKGKGKGIPVQA